MAVIEPTTDCLNERFRSHLVGKSSFNAFNSEVEAFIRDFDPRITYPYDWWECRLRSKSVFNQVLNSFAGVFSYAVPTVEIVADIGRFVRGKTIHEYLAGSGYWAYTLENWGMNVYASDIRSPVYDFNLKKPFVEIHHENVSNSLPNKSEVVFMCWPPVALSANVMPLLAKMFKSQKLIYIADKGCCANDETHQYLEDRFHLIYSSRVPGYYGDCTAEFYSKR